MFLNYLNSWGSPFWILWEWLLKRILDLKTVAREQGNITAQILLWQSPPDFDHLRFPWIFLLTGSGICERWEEYHMTWFPLVDGQDPSSLNNMNCYWLIVVWGEREEKGNLRGKEQRTWTERGYGRVKRKEDKWRENEISHFMMTLCPAFSVLFFSLPWSVPGTIIVPLAEWICSWLQNNDFP